MGIWPIYIALFIAILSTGLSIFMVAPATQAYLGDLVTFERRGTPMALAEFSWSGALIIGVPFVGLLIATWGWQAPFPVLAALGGLLLWRTLPNDRYPRIASLSLRGGFSAILKRRSAVAGLGVSLLITAANEVVSIVYGLWFEDAFGLAIVALSAATAVIGLGELGGEGLVAGVTDRLGKRRSVAIGISLTALASLALPILGSTLSGALFALFMLYLCFEFTVVSMLPLMTEQVASARGPRSWPQISPRHHWVVAWGR